MVDNCYGEFVETHRALRRGSGYDCVGSLIKNPGGGLAPVGGYIAGTEDCIETCSLPPDFSGPWKRGRAQRLASISPSYQGLFLAPTVTARRVKGCDLWQPTSMNRLGFPVVPNGTESRHDIIQAVDLRKGRRASSTFCKGIQAAAPVDSYVTPEPWAMPGYDSDVIMAAGAFVQGSSIELSADGPIKPPYAVYFQGGLTYPHAKLGILMSLEKLVEAGIVTLP